MVNKKISELDPAATITGTEVVPLLQAGATKAATVQQLLALITAAAPGNLDTFFEVATQMGLDEATVTTLQALVAGKADTTAVAATYTPKLLSKPSIGDTLPKATPSGNLAWSLVNKGNYISTDSIGIDGVVYGHQATTQFVSSSDQFQSFPPVLYDFTAQSPNNIIWSTRTTEGFVVVTTNAGSDISKVFFSTAATGPYTAVLTCRAIQTQSIAKPVPGPFGKTLLLIGEYGPGGTTPRKLYLSVDGGQTWAPIRSSLNPNTAINSHFHSSAYDRTRNRIWTCSGDLDNTWFGYSDDLGKSWIGVPVGAASMYATGHASNPYPQPLSLMSTPEMLLATPDGGQAETSGIFGIDPDTLQPHTLFNLPSGEIDYQQFGYSQYAQRGREIYVAYPDTGSGSKKTYFAGSGDSGRSWWSLGSFDWTDTTGTVAGVIGIDQYGYLYHTSSNSVQYGAGVKVIQALPPTWTWSSAS